MISFQTAFLPYPTAFVGFQTPFSLCFPGGKLFIAQVRGLLFQGCFVYQLAVLRAFQVLNVWMIYSHQDRQIINNDHRHT